MSYSSTSALDKLLEEMVGQLQKAKLIPANANQAHVMNALKMELQPLLKKGASTLNLNQTNEKQSLALLAILMAHFQVKHPSLLKNKLFLNQLADVLLNTNKLDPNTLKQKMRALITVLNNPGAGKKKNATRLTTQEIDKLVDEMYRLSAKDDKQVTAVDLVNKLLSFYALATLNANQLQALDKIASDTRRNMYGGDDPLLVGEIPSVVQRAVGNMAGWILYGEANNSLAAIYDNARIDTGPDPTGKETISKEHAIALGETMTWVLRKFIEQNQPELADDGIDGPVIQNKSKPLSP